MPITTFFCLELNRPESSETIETLQIARSLFIGVILVVFVIAFFVGIGFIDSTNSEKPTSLTDTVTAFVTTTATSFVTEKLSNSNISIVKEILIEHLFTNGICTLSSENTTVTTTLLSAVGNPENSLYVTFRTTTISYNTTSTIYENVTIISDGTTSNALR